MERPIPPGSLDEHGHPPAPSWQPSTPKAPGSTGDGRVQLQSYLGKGGPEAPPDGDYPTNFIPNAEKRFSHKRSDSRELCTTELCPRAGQGVSEPAAPLPPPGRSSGTSPAQHTPGDHGCSGTGTDPEGVPCLLVPWGLGPFPPRDPAAGSCLQQSSSGSGWIRAWSEPTEGQHPQTT